MNRELTNLEGVMVLVILALGAVLASGCATANTPLREYEVKPFTLIVASPEYIQTAWESTGGTRDVDNKTTNAYRYFILDCTANGGDTNYVECGPVRWFDDGYIVNTELRVMDSAGNITTISPHSTSLFPKQLREKRRLTFTHYEKSVELDYEMNIDMIGFVKFMEKHYNRQWIYSRKLSDPTDTNVVWELDN